MSAKQRAIGKKYSQLSKEEKEKKRQDKAKNNLIREASKAFEIIANKNGLGTCNNPINSNVINSRIDNKIKEPIYIIPKKKSRVREKHNQNIKIITIIVNAYYTIK